MGLLRSVLALPVAGPMQGTMWIAKKIHERAETEFNDPAAIRKALATLERQLLNHQITEEAYDDAETALLLRLKNLS